MSHSASARRTACSSAAASSGKAPNGTGSPPASATAAATIAPLLNHRRRRAAALAPGGTSSSPVESTATFGLRTTSIAGKPAGRQHADLARADRLALAQQRLAARDVGAGVGDELARRDGAAQLDRRHVVSISSVCSIITTASAPRGTTPPVAMVVAVPGRTSIFGAWPQAITSALSVICFGAASAAPAVSAARSAKPSTLARSNGGTSIGAADRPRQHAAERSRERHAFGGQRREIEMALEALARLLGRHDFEELLLARGRADRGEQARRFGLRRFDALLMATASPTTRGALRIAFAVGGDEDPAVGA